MKSVVEVECFEQAADARGVDRHGYPLSGPPADRPREQMMLRLLGCVFVVDQAQAGPRRGGLRRARPGCRRRCPLRSWRLSVSSAAWRSG